MNILKQKMKFLATKLSALQEELVVSKEIFQIASGEVEKMFTKKYYPEHPVKQKTENQNQTIKEYSEEEAANNKQKQQEQSQKTQDPNAPDQETAEKSASPEVRKMFRKIATHCHPDKLGGMEDGFEKRKKEELYQKAREALENNDVLRMADVAQDLGVEVPEITEAQLKQTEQKIVSIKKELSMIESTAVWHWFFTEDPVRKDAILEQIFEAMYGKGKPNPGA